MREGQRDGEDEASDAGESGDDTQTDADEAQVDAGESQADATDTTDEPAQTGPTAEGAQAESTAADTDGATASTDGGATAAPTEPEEAADDDSETADSAEEVESDPDVSEAVDDVSGTRAELPSTEQMEAAMEQTMEQVEEGEAEAETETDSEEESASPAGIAEDKEVEQTQEADTRVLEFTLDDEQYCLDIQYIEEIVKHTNITRVPNTPDFVEGVVDLRGQITTILNPKVTIGKNDMSAGDLIVVFDSEAFEDQGHIGWVVDDVRQVSPISEDEVNDPPMQEDYINGVIDRDDGEFVIWTTPDLALEEAE